MTTNTRLRFLVGPNGSGKTRRLIRISEIAPQKGHRIAAIANTPFTTFPKSIGVSSFTVSPKEIPRIVAKNLAQFFDAEGRDTFDMSDLLQAIGLDPTVSIAIETDEEKIQLSKLLFRKSEVGEAVHSSLLFLSANENKATLSRDSSIYSRSLRGQHRIIFKHIRKLQRSGIVKSYNLIFSKKENGKRREKSFSELSSGEQTIISTYLFIRANLEHLETLLIDEPENSLHPEWQRQYMDFIHMALGYSDTRIIMASHSPLLVSGTLSSYGDEVSVVKVSDGAPDEDVFAHGGEAGSVEEILWRAFQTITPTNHFLSSEISDIIQNMIEGATSESDAIAQLKEFKDSSYDQTQSELISEIIKKLPELLQNAALD